MLKTMEEQHIRNVCKAYALIYVNMDATTLGCK
jgi:hypothetical protein